MGHVPRPTFNTSECGVVAVSAVQSNAIHFSYLRVNSKKATRENEIIIKMKGKSCVRVAK